LYRMTAAPHVIAVPYFLASGSHTSLDVPKQLGLPDGQTAGYIHGRNVYYTPPVGESDTLRDLALDLARGAGVSLYPPRSGSAWDGFPAAGQDELIDIVVNSGSIEFGQLTLTPSRVYVTADTEDTIALTTPASLRAWVREEPFRPLPTSRDLPGGWHVEISAPDMLHAVVETVYPGVVADWAAHRHGKLHVNSLADVAARQTGMFRELDSLSEQTKLDLVATVCGQCVRQPTWYHGISSVIPCPEPCNFWMSKARKQQ